MANIIKYRNFTPDQAESIRTRLYKYVTVGPGCWNWTGHVSGGYYLKYGRIRMGGKYGKMMQSHRIAFELEFGGIPDGLHLCHKCDNPLCCRPSHMFLGTQAENNADKARKNRASRLFGNRNGRAKLIPGDAERIRDMRACGVSLPKISRHLSFSISTIHRVDQCRAW